MSNEKKAIKYNNDKRKECFSQHFIVHIMSHLNVIETRITAEQWACKIKQASHKGCTTYTGCDVNVHLAHKDFDTKYISPDIQSNLFLWNLDV